MEFSKVQDFCRDRHWVLFFTLEDETGLVDVVSRKGCRFWGRVEPWAVLQVEGRVTDRMGVPVLEARSVRREKDPEDLPWSRFS